MISDLAEYRPYAARILRRETLRRGWIEGGSLPNVPREGRRRSRRPDRLGGCHGRARDLQGRSVGVLAVTRINPVPQPCVGRDGPRQSPGRSDQQLSGGRLDGGPSRMRWGVHAGRSAQSAADSGPLRLASSLPRTALAGSPAMYQSAESIGITMKTGSPVKLIIRKTMTDTQKSTSTICRSRLIV